MLTAARLADLLLSLLLVVTAAAPVVRPATLPPPPAPRIGIFYYPWYANPTTNGSWFHWNGEGRFTPPDDIASDYYPALGPYSAHDPATVAQHMAWIEEAGAEVLIVSWWGRGSFEDQAVPEVLRQAEQAGLQVAFHLEPYRGRSATQLVSDVQYLEATYGASPAFFRSTAGSGYNAAGKASGLFFLWNPEQQYDGGPVVDAAYWRPALDEIHALPAGGLVMVQKTDGAWVEGGHFDGAYDYTNADTVPPTWGYRLPEAAWFIPAVMPGFSAQRIGYHDSTYRAREAGALYARQWRSVLESGITPPLIAVTSFNEWHEGSQIEPDQAGKTNGKGYSYPSYEEGPAQYLAATARWAAAARALPALACAQQLSIALQAENLGQGLYQRDLEDGVTAAATVGGRAARQAVDNEVAPARYIYFWAQDAFQQAQAVAVTVTVDYYDAAAGTLALDYDSTDPSWPLEGAYKRTEAVALVGDGAWHTATFVLPDAYFGARQNGGADLRIALPEIDFSVGRLTVAKEALPCLTLYLPGLAK